jgi:hypothetical protein
MKLLSLTLLATIATAIPLQHKHHDHPREIVQTTTTVYVDRRDGATAAADTPAASSAAVGLGGVQGDLGDFVDPTKEFEDGVHDCLSVPVGQGVVAVDWISGLNGGWTSIMAMDGSTSETCKDGFYCSYACQAGMSKTQWPQNQPNDGRSVGGLQCKGGKLYRTNRNSKFLCSWGSDTASFESNLDDVVSICRTDYPGSENMNIPTYLAGGKTKPCSVVDGNTYYKWEGKPTSTQYYVNNAGVNVTEGCIWGTPGSGVGNWAPVVLGAGHIDGNTYLSLIPNPNNLEKPNYNIKIVAAPGSTVVGDCKYENGQYTGSGSDGCTVTVTSGKANFVFY